MSVRARNRFIKLIITVTFISMVCAYLLGGTFGVLVGIMCDLVALWWYFNDDNDHRKRKRAKNRGGINWLRRPITKVIPRPQ